MTNGARSKIQYLRDRLVNAYWMVREGRFQLVIKSLWQELALRGQQLSALVPDEADLPKHRESGDNPFKKTPPSDTPTQMTELSGKLDLSLERDELVSLLQDLCENKAPQGQSK